MYEDVCFMIDSDRAHLQLNNAPLYRYIVDNILYNHQIACIGTVYNVVDHCITRWYDFMSSTVSFADQRQLLQPLPPFFGAQKVGYV